VYLTLLRGSHRSSRRLRCCPADRDELLASHAKEWTNVDDVDDPDSLGACAVCGASPGRDTATDPLFVNVYHKEETPLFLIAYYCEEHGDRLIKDFKLKDSV